MSLEQLHPYAGTHAVQNVVFALEWSESLSTDSILDATKLATKFRNVGLPCVQTQNMLELNLADGKMQQSKRPGGELGGVMFSAHEPATATSRIVSISRSSAMIMIPDYTRWDKVWTDAQEYLKLILEEIGPSRPLAVIGLQYCDVFSWNDTPSELNISEIFLKDSFIPPHAFSQTNLWHAHHGYIESFETPIASSVLQNVNVDLNDVGGKRTFQIVGSHRATLKEPMWQSHLKNKQSLLAMFVALHASNKKMLGQLLTPAVSAKISLNLS